MAVTQNTYTGDGSTVLFSFTFPYLETTDIKVSLDGSITTAYTLANATTIQFNTAPTNGAAIRIYRVTDDSALSAQFYPGSAIRSQDLNDNFTQSLYVAQETATAQQNLETYVDNTFVEDTRVHFTGDTWSNTDDYNIPTVQAVSDRLISLRESGLWDTRYYTESELNGGKLDTRYYTKTALNDGALDSRYYTETETLQNFVHTWGTAVYVSPSAFGWSGTDQYVPTQLNITNYLSGKIKTSSNAFTTSGTDIASPGYIDQYYYKKSDTWTRTEADDRYYNIATESIKSTVNWTTSDDYVATTAAIDARIITLVDGIGGFIPVASHTTLPADFNPDLDDGGSNVVVSIQSVNGLEHANGVSTNATTINGVTAYITGIPTSLPSPLGDVGMLITTSAINQVPYYIFHRLTPEVNDVITVAQNATEIATVAGQITPFNNVGTVAGIASSVSTVASNNANVTTVAGNIANVNTVAGISSNVTTVAGISSNVTTVAGNTANINAVAADASDIGTVATNIANVNNVSGSIANVNTVATNIADVNAVAADASDIGAVATNIGAVAAVGSDLANSFSNIDDYGGITDPVTSTPGGTSDIQTVATDIANVNTVAGSIANVNNTGNNIASVNTAATNIAAIIAAPTEAANAASSASAALTSETNAAASASAAATSETNAAASATNAATSASAAATSESNAATSAGNASSSATAAAGSASNAATSAANALVSEQNADASEALALQYRDDTAGILTQSGSDTYTVSTNQSWGDIITGALNAFDNEILADILLTMSKGTNTYDYGTL